jgi:hypothetical protein
MSFSLELRSSLVPVDGDSLMSFVKLKRRPPQSVKCRLDGRRKRVHEVTVTYPRPLYERMDPSRMMVKPQHRWVATCKEAESRLSPRPIAMVK